MKCIRCGRDIPDGSKFCTYCGAQQEAAVQAQTVSSVQPAAQNYSQVYVQNPVQPAVSVVQPLRSNIAASENVGKGLLGALLLGLVGVAIYVGIYQLGYILFASGVIIFNLCMMGYNKLSGHDASQHFSKKGVLICGAVALFVMLISEYLCIGIEIFKEYKGYGVTLAESFKAIPDFLAEEEVLWGCLKDVGISFVVFVVFFFMTLYGSRNGKQRVRKNRNPVQQNGYMAYPQQSQQYQPQQYQPQQYQAQQPQQYQVTQPGQGQYGQYPAQNYPQQYQQPQSGNGGQNWPNNNQ